MSRRTSMTEDEKVKVPQRRGSSNGSSVKHTLEPTLPADVCMEAILDKLAILQYEEKFCKAKQPYRPLLHKFFFALPAVQHSTGQFSYFVNLVTWLLSFFGKKIPAPKDFDDPSIVCASLMNEIKACGFSAPTFSLTKLHKGYGDEICGVLNALLDAVLQNTDFQFLPPLFLANEQIVEEDDSDLDEAEISLDEMVEPTGGGISMTDYFTDPATHVGYSKQIEKSPANIDSEGWSAEIARVAPALRKHPAIEVFDWRLDLKKARGTLNALFSMKRALQEGLKKSCENISNCASQIAAKEAVFHQKCCKDIKGYEQRRQEFHEITTRHNNVSTELSTLHKQQHDLGEECDRIVKQIEDKGYRLSDVSPLVRIRNSVDALRQDVARMNAAIGFMSHATLQYASLQKKKENGTICDDAF